MTAAAGEDKAAAEVEVATTAAEGVAAVTADVAGAVPLAEEGVGAALAASLLRLRWRPSQVGLTSPPALSPLLPWLPSLQSPPSLI